MAQDLQASLDKVNTAIDTLMDGGAIQEYMIGGRNIKKYDLNQLLKLRDQFKMELAVKNGRTRTYVRFRRPS